MTDAAVAALVDAVAWSESLRRRVTPYVDLSASLGALGDADFEQLAEQPHVETSPLLQQVVGLERMRRAGRIAAWDFRQVTDEGQVRLHVQGPVESRTRMILLRA